MPKWFERSSLPADTGDHDTPIRKRFWDSSVDGYRGTRLSSEGNQSRHDGAEELYIANGEVDLSDRINHEALLGHYAFAVGGTR